MLQLYYDKKLFFCSAISIGWTPSMHVICNTVLHFSKNINNPLQAYPVLLVVKAHKLANCGFMQKILNTSFDKTRILENKWKTPILVNPYIYNGFVPNSRETNQDQYHHTAVALCS